MIEHGVGAIGATLIEAEMKTLAVEEVVQVLRCSGDVDGQTQGGLFVEMDAGSRESETDDGRGGPPEGQGEENDGPVGGDDGAGVHSVEKSVLGPWHPQVATNAARRSPP
jgi:hypothetical protein